jgi:putative spermidine/putrescine transport system ATP-binding protein
VSGSSEARAAGAAIELDGVTRRYGPIVAVDAVSLRVLPGEFVAMLGPSGSGKTTTLMLIAGFEMPSSGQIRIDGVSVTALPPHRRNIGVVFQSYALFPHLTVFENIAFPLRVRRVGRPEIEERARAALGLVRLPSVEDRYPGQLSGGQQQRVAVARALVFGPRVLLMDEPLGALDRSLREEMQYELRALQHDLGVTVVYVTHDQGEAMAMADRIAVMASGRIRQVDAPTVLYERPADRFVASFVGECNFLRAKVDSSRTAVVSPSGRVPVPANVTGSVVELAIRPEAIRFPGDVAPGQVVALDALVVSVTFLGAISRVQLRLGDGQTLVAVRSRGAGTPMPVGGRVAVAAEISGVYEAEEEKPSPVTHSGLVTSEGLESSRRIVES